MQPLPTNAMGPLPFINDTVMVVSDDDKFDQMDNDDEKDDIADWNDEMDDDYEDDYSSRHDDCSEDDRGEDNVISDCNHADGSIEHATTVVLEGVQCDDHATTIVLEDVECDDLIYDNPIIGRIEMSFEHVGSKEHFKIRVKNSCHTHLEVACKEKGCKFASHATKLPEGDYWQVWMFHKVNTCNIDGLQGGCRTASTRLIGELISPKLQGNNVTPLRPKKIMEEMNHNWGLACLWRFSAVLWPIIAIDATYLKSRFKGILFVAICKDTNKQIYPVAFGIGHIEDEDSWLWFLT
ncbi:Uncharacterized protein TCM_018625 [Theobroma cacao]|uniref:MULE transposase domain-containing protein n=1 Tax=Theobroma cacao TaxID=3641 RepID=A0A061EMH2_THECC|nr:Uncharacterized protein TCM_018625 [Theobroma cacao]